MFNSATFSSNLSMHLHDKCPHRRISSSLLFFPSDSVSRHTKHGPFLNSTANVALSAQSAGTIPKTDNSSFATRLLGGERSLHQQKACPIVTGMIYFPSFIHIWSFLKCYRRNLTNQTAERKQFQLIKKTDKVGLPRIFCRAIGSREGNIWAVHHFDLY